MNDEPVYVPEDDPPFDIQCKHVRANGARCRSWVYLERSIAFDPGALEPYEGRYVLSREAARRLQAQLCWRHDPDWNTMPRTYPW